mgnify:CR=1 FL=1
MADAIVCHRNQLRRRPIVLSQGENSGIGKTLGKPDDVADVCPAEPINRLVVVAHDGDAPGLGRAEQLQEAQLERETQKFLREPRNVSVDDKMTVILSQIFEWYAVDFPPSPVEWIRAKAPDISLPAAGDPAMKISHRPYDWALNVQPK